MWKRIAPVLIAAAAIGLLALTPAAANPYPPAPTHGGVVTPAEYRSAVLGVRKEWIQRMWGTRGANVRTWSGTEGTRWRLKRYAVGEGQPPGTWVEATYRKSAAGWWRLHRKQWCQVGADGTAVCHRRIAS